MARTESNDTAFVKSPYKVCRTGSCRGIHSCLSSQALRNRSIPSETDIPLAASGIVVSVSDTYELGGRPDDQRLTIDPDMPVPLTADDYFTGRDPALAAILAAGERSPLTAASGSVLSPSR